MKAILKVDVLSYNFHLRGNAGDEVEILFDHENVKIVENTKGQRFAVHELKLDYEGVSSGINNYKKESSQVDSSKGKKPVRKSTSNGKRRNSTSLF